MKLRDKHLLFFGCCILTAIIIAVLPVRDRKEPTLEQAAQEALPKAVMIEVDTDIVQLEFKFTKRGFEIDKATVTVTIAGSGVFISRNGHVLTCAHLFTTGKLRNIRVIGYERPDTHTLGRTLLVDEIRDLALVKIEKRTPHYARMAPVDSLRVGQSVFAIGNPLRRSFSVTHGVVSALNKLAETYGVQTDTFINPGNSGGPLFDLKGRIVGINVAIHPPVNAPIFTGIGLATSVRHIRDFLSPYIGLERILEDSI